MSSEFCTVISYVLTTGVIRSGLHSAVITRGHVISDEQPAVVTTTVSAAVTSTTTASSSSISNNNNSTAVTATSCSSSSSSRSSSSAVTTAVITADTNDENSSQSPLTEASDTNRGKQFTSQGPPQYEGKDILEDPQLLWLDDAEWDEERVLEAQERIKVQGANAPIFWRDKYVREASKYWHIFYKRNTDHFYKDRHYLHVVFPELLMSPRDDSIDGRAHLLEVGCGVGNAVLPLVELNPLLSIHCIDFAASAIEILRANPMVVQSDGNIKADVCDVAEDPLPVLTGTQDLVLCMFVLSAIAPKTIGDAQQYKSVHKFLFIIAVPGNAGMMPLHEAQPSVLRKLTAALKPGGKMMIRDYGRYDEAQLRFKKGSKLEDNFYVRQDGTCAYYFDLNELQSMCESEGLEMEKGENILRQYANRQQKVARHRVWIQATFIKK